MRACLCARARVVPPFPLLVTVFNYRLPRTQKYVKYQDRKIVAGSGMNLEPNLFLPGNIKERVGKNPPSDVLIMNNLETMLSTTADKARGNTSGSIVGRFIKPRASKMSGHPVNSLDGPGQSIAVSGPHEEFFNSYFALWIGGNHF